jgi:anthranilate synthase component 1
VGRDSPLQRDAFLPTSVSVRDGILDPVNTFLTLRRAFPGDCFLLESVEDPEKAARYSFIGVDPVSSFVFEGGEVIIDGERAEVTGSYDALRDHFKTFLHGSTDVAPFCGGMVGYIGYGMVREFDGIEQPLDDLLTPDMCFMLPRHLICIDHLTKRSYLISHGEIDLLKKSIDGIEDSRIKVPMASIDDSVQNIEQPVFEDMVSVAKENILEGEIFQVVPSRSVDFKVRGDPFHMYNVLRSVNPSPYLFYMDFGKTKLIGSSPEMLVRLEGSKLTTRPLAGTRPRHPDPEEDEKLKLEMLLDEKERAEHLMLVDLHRNDMGKVSRTGTVKVTELMNVEKFSHVQHIVSNIESELSREHDAFDALRACFPAGTVTGAPKIRAMEIISELEKSGRGPYAGAAGYFDFNGNMDFGIVIRSIVVNGNRGRVQAGAGIVHDSIPEREYRETQAKMGALLQALRSMEVIG